MEGKPFRNNKELLAYVIGLALGDGNLSNPNGRVVRLRISCDLKYPQLIENIKLAIKTLFPLNKVSTVPRKGCLDVSCYSNHWPKLLGWEAKQGSKFIQNVTVPLWVFTKKEYIINCLKGLIETDGSIYYDRGYPMIMFTSIIGDLAENFDYMMRSLGFSSKMYKISKLSNPNAQTIYHVRLSKNVKLFLDLVQPQKL
jgi:hypothetical protein